MPHTEAPCREDPHLAKRPWGRAEDRRSDVWWRPDKRDSATLLDTGFNSQKLWAVQRPCQSWLRS